MQPPPTAQFLGIRVQVAVAGFDATDAFLNGLSPTKSHFTDFAHVSRKIKEENAPRKLKNEGNLGYVKVQSESPPSYTFFHIPPNVSPTLAHQNAIDLMHVCTTEEQFNSLAQPVLTELKRRKEDELIEYLTRPSRGYFVKPWNR